MSRAINTWAIRPRLTARKSSSRDQRVLRRFGRTSGGILTVVTRSGTNEMRGTAYEFHRNDALDSPGFFTKRAGLEQPDFKRNQFGGVAGGPIKRDRTFFFGAMKVSASSSRRR